MIRSSFDDELKQLKENLLQMGGLVESALKNSIISLKNMDDQLAEEIKQNDKKVNEYEELIETNAIHLIATQQPVAKDLRKIITAIKIAGELERMGDFAVNIARATIRLKGQILIKPLVDIPRMANIAGEMIKQGLNAYIDENVEQAKSMSEMDDEVDALYKGILNEMFAIMSKDPESISQATQLAFVGRYIERIGDHATNIGENVIYLVSGKKPDLNV